MRRIGNGGRNISQSPKVPCSWFGGCEIASERKHETLRSIDARSEIHLSHASGFGMRSTQRKLHKPSVKAEQRTAQGSDALQSSGGPFGAR
jgi:hypothetical protein